MGKNREAELLKVASGGILRIGRAIATLFFIMAFVSLCILVAGIAIPIFADPAFDEWPMIFYEALGQLSMLVVYLLGAFFALDVGRGETPFSDKQAKRVMGAACVMAAYTLCCFVWEPVSLSIQIAQGTVSAAYGDSGEPATFFINFGTLLAAAILFFFSYIIHYGKTLQMFADETQ